jgi:hypothetical protein
MDPKIVKKAFKAYKKKLGLTQLVEDSKVSTRQMTSGSTSSIVAIQPPFDFPPEVWTELVRQGKLKTYGGGLYELVKI